MVGKWHLCPTDEMNLAAPRRNWPSGRGFERWYGFLGAETNQWYPDLVYDNHPVDQPKTPEEGYHLTDDITDKAIEFIKDAKAIAPEKPFFLYYAPGRLPRAAPRAQGVDRQVQGPVRHGLRGDARADAGAPEEDGPRPAPTPSCRRSTPSARPRRAQGPDGKPFPAMDVTKPWDSLSDGEKRLFSRMAEVYAGFLAHADHHIGRLLDYLESSGQRENTLVDPRVRQRRQRRGRPQRVGQREPAVQRHARRPRVRPSRCSTSWAAPRPTTTTPNGWAMAFNTPFKMWKRYEFNGGTSRPVHHLVAGGHEGEGRDQPAVPPRDRPRADGARLPRRRSSRRRSRGTCRAPSTA